MIRSELIIKEGEYPSQYPRHELFRFYLRRGSGKRFGQKILAKMFKQRSPVWEITFCFEHIIKNYMTYRNQILKISSHKIKMMQKGLIISKPKVLKNGHHYLDKQEIQELLPMFLITEKQLGSIDLDLKSKLDWGDDWKEEKTIEASEPEFFDYYFRVTTSLFLSCKSANFEEQDEINIEEFYLVWAVRLKKWSQIVQLAQAFIFKESLFLAFLFCELGSQSPVVQKFQKEGKLLDKQPRYLNGLPNLDSKEMFQIGLQIMKKQRK